MLLEELSVSIKRARSSKAEWTSRRLSAHISAVAALSFSSLQSSGSLLARLIQESESSRSSF
jgi:hypothetical protein